MMKTSLAVLAALGMSVSAETAINATFGATAAGPVSSTAPGVTFDYWLFNDTNFGQKWQNTSILLIDLNEPNVIAAATALAGATLRIGGSPVNSIFYDTQGICNPGGHGPSDTYYCSQVKPYIYGCLTPQRWTEILQFTKKTGIKLIMGMNACFGRTGPNEPMDFSNIQTFLDSTKAMGDDLLSQLVGFELGNEVILDGGISAEQYSKDAAVVKQMIDTTFGPGRYLFAGPADFTAQASAVISDAPSSTFNLITYHDYPNCLPTSTNAFAISCLSKLDTNAATLSNAVKKANKTFTVWAGETSDYYRGGQPGVNNAFNDVFYFLWQLSALPLNGVPNAVRQCLVGGDYELVSRYDYTANPSFWAAYLYKSSLAGAVSFPVTQSISYETSGLRVFGFVDVNNKKVAVIINTNLQSSFTVTLSGFSSTVNVWRLTASSLSSQQVLLNGTPLQFTNSTATKVPPTPWATDSNPIAVGAMSVIFARSN